jgi:hypothetical protein
MSVDPDLPAAHLRQPHRVGGAEVGLPRDVDPQAMKQLHPLIAVPPAFQPARPNHVTHSELPCETSQQLRVSSARRVRQYARVGAASRGSIDDDSRRHGVKGTTLEVAACAAIAGRFRAMGDWTGIAWSCGQSRRRGTFTPLLPARDLSGPAVAAPGFRDAREDAVFGSGAADGGSGRGAGPRA